MLQIPATVVSDDEGSQEADAETPFEDFHAFEGTLVWCAMGWGRWGEYPDGNEIRQGIFQAIFVLDVWNAGINSKSDTEKRSAT